MTTHSRGTNVKRVEVVWPEELVAQIDGARGPLSRSAWLRRLAEERVAGKVADSVKARAERLVQENGEALERLAEGIHEDKERLKEQRPQTFKSSPLGLKSARQLLAEDSTESLELRGVKNILEGEVESARERLARRTAQMRGPK